MKIIKIIGGLGNQMFQYALAIALQQQYKDEEIRLDLNCFRGYNKHQGYLLDELLLFKKWRDWLGLIRIISFGEWVVECFRDDKPWCVSLLMAAFHQTF